MWRSVSLIFTNYENSKKNNKKNVFVLGQGWVAKGFIEHINKSKYNIINITKNNFINVPLVLSTIKTNNNLNDNQFQNKIDILINETIENIDVVNNTIKTNNKLYSFKNDFLVVGLGPTQENSQIWLNNINKIKKYQPNSNISISGSGPTGTELAFYLKDLGHRVSIFDILPYEKLYGYLSDEGKKLIIDKLMKNNIHLYGNSQQIGEFFVDHIQAFGPRSNILTQNWKLNSKLQLELNKSIYAGGDCILQPYPPTAQVAYQQGKYIAQQLNGTNDQDFVYENKGIALYTGNDMHYVEMKIFGKEFKLNLPSKLIYYYKSL